MTVTNPVSIRARLRRELSIAAITTIAGIGAVMPGAANAAGTDPQAEAGQQIFQQKCAACHTVGKGDLVGPDLEGITTHRPTEWLQRWIAAPDEMLAENDPVAIALLHKFHDVPMPNLQLSAPEITAVLAYLATTTPGAPAESSAAAVGPSAASRSVAAATPPISSSVVAVGDPRNGKELFTGATRFGNGGPSCMACHSVAGIGALGGGQLGPDLTTVVTRFGGVAAVSAFIGGSPTPTMAAVWARTPLTAGERADLTAFLAQAAVSQRPAQAIWNLAGLSVLGLVAVFAITGWVWGRRLHEVRRPMIAARREARG